MQDTDFIKFYYEKIKKKQSCDARSYLKINVELTKNNERS